MPSAPPPCPQCGLFAGPGPTAPIHTLAWHSLWQIIVIAASCRSRPLEIAFIDRLCIQWPGGKVLQRFRCLCSCR